MGQLHRLPQRLPQSRSSSDLAEHCQIWETTQGVQVSSATMSRAIQRLNWTRKKKTDAAQVNRRKRSAQLGKSKPKHSMPANWSSSMNAARTLP